MKYQVQITDFTAHGVHRAARRRLSFAQAWRIVHHNARRGLKLYGGSIAYGNWGVRAGVFPGRYRSAVITIDTWPPTPLR